MCSSQVHQFLPARSLSVCLSVRVFLRMCLSHKMMGFFYRHILVNIHVASLVCPQATRIRYNSRPDKEQRPILTFSPSLSLLGHVWGEQILSTQRTIRHQTYLALNLGKPGYKQYRNSLPRHCPFIYYDNIK